MSKLSQLLVLAVLLAGPWSTAEAQPSNQKQVSVIHIEDMHCKHCAQKIGGSIYTVKGVAKVAVNYDKKVLIVTPSRGKTLSELDLWEAVEKADFIPQKIVSPRGTFAEKPKRAPPSENPAVSFRSKSPRSHRWLRSCLSTCPTKVV